ncbi:Family S53 protease-like protein [Mycena sanguinolenta]|uniref:Family S53 protease-like protein n=1 Tax=Mycena sanguinolenta TaxID=230812 RepID=A0A8H7D7N3_9AGAR|nr:Family S53 protease-like protein [Mycena sanguinolenta]
MDAFCSSHLSPLRPLRRWSCTSDVLPLPAGFVSVGAAPASEMITLRVALTSNNVAGLQDQLLSIATPGSSNYRQWLSMDDVKTYAQPCADTVSAFNAFASANGLTPTVISPNGDWLSITLSVSQANTLFAAKFERFTHPSLNGSITRTLSVSLPSELVGHVDVIHPTTAFATRDVRLVPRMRRLAGRDGPASSCNSSDPAGVITPTCLQELYGIPTTPATETSNALLATGYVDFWAQQADLSQFLSLLRPDISPPTTFTLLITERILKGLPTLGLKQIWISNILRALQQMYPSNSSLTWHAYALAGKSAIGTWLSVLAEYLLCFLLEMGGVRGNHDTLDVCTNNTFMPVFPAACPFVTAVGSTQGFAPEKAINFTGGGFSNVFPTPHYL